MIEVSINGERKAVSSSTISELVSELELENKRIAVELNREIVPRDAFDKTNLSSGDELELVHFVGGG